MVSATRHTGIVVRDLEKSLCFWRDVMGLKVVADFREEGQFIDTVQQLKRVKLRMIKLSAPDGSMIELLHDQAHPTPFPKRNRLCNRGIRHIAFTVPDAAKAWRTLKKNGCKLLSRPVVAPDRKAKLFFACDPEGNFLEIVEVLKD